jgi:hypothetical protein
MIEPKNRALAETILAEFEGRLAAYEAASRICDPNQNAALGDLNMILNGPDSQVRLDLVHAEADAQLADAEAKAAEALNGVYSDPQQRREAARRTDGYRIAELRHEGIDVGGDRGARSVIEVLKLGLGLAL